MGDKVAECEVEDGEKTGGRSGSSFCMGIFVPPSIAKMVNKHDVWI